MHRTQVLILSLLVVVLSFLIETSFGTDSTVFLAFLLKIGLLAYSVFWVFKILDIYKIASNNGFNSLSSGRRINYYLLLYSLPALMLLVSVRLTIRAIIWGSSSDDIGAGFSIIMALIEIIFLSLVISSIHSLIKYNSWKFLEVLYQFLISLIIFGFPWVIIFILFRQSS